MEDSISHLKSILLNPSFLHCFIYSTNTFENDIMELACADRFGVVQSIQVIFSDFQIIAPSFITITSKHILPERNIYEGNKQQIQSQNESKGMNIFSSLVQKLKVKDDQKSISSSKIGSFSHIHKGESQLMAFMNQKTREMGRILGERVSEGGYQQWIKDIGCGIGSFILSMGQQPIVRYSKDSLIGHRIGEVIIEHVRQGLNKQFQFKDVIPINSGPSPILLIVDRLEDAVSPCIISWTYEAMIDQIIGISNGSIEMNDDKDKQTKTEDPLKKKRMVLSSIQDPVFQKILKQLKIDLPTYLPLHAQIASKINRKVVTDNWMDHTDLIRSAMNNNSFSSIMKLNLLFLFGLRYIKENKAGRIINDLLSSCKPIIINNDLPPISEGDIYFLTQFYNRGQIRDINTGLDGETMIGKAQSMVRQLLPTSFPQASSSSNQLIRTNQFALGQGFQTAPAFGQPQQPPPVFGQGLQTGNAFGQQQQTPFGQGQFGQAPPQNKIFGPIQSASSFGQGQQQSNPFNPTQQQSNPLGQNLQQNNAFGQQQPTIPFGQPQQPVNPFGQPQQPVNPFGQPQQPVNPFSQPQQPVNPFGQPQQPVNPFGQPQQPVNPFGQPQQPANLLSQPQQPANPFSQPQQPANPFSQPQQPANPFSQPQQPANPFSQQAQQNNPFNQGQQTSNQFAQPLTNQSNQAQPISNTFGQPQQQSNPFTLTQPTSSLGQQQPITTPFGQNQQVSQFGQQPANAFNQQPLNVFGQPQQQNIPFGQQQPANAFGQQTNQQSIPIGSIFQGNTLTSAQPQQNTISQTPLVQNLQSQTQPTNPLIPSVPNQNPFGQQQQQQNIFGAQSGTQSSATNPFDLKQQNVSNITNPINTNQIFGTGQQIAPTQTALGTGDKAIPITQTQPTIFPPQIPSTSNQTIIQQPSTVQVQATSTLGDKTTAIQSIVAQTNVQQSSTDKTNTQQASKDQQNAQSTSQPQTNVQQPAIFPLSFPSVVNQTTIPSTTAQTSTVGDKTTTIPSTSAQTNVQSNNAQISIGGIPPLQLPTSNASSNFFQTPSKADQTSKVQNKENALFPPPGNFRVILGPDY
ncbi:MAG: hypothetical protein EZS28_010896 [Streblomastix strix]|uniref:Uncharacterized protein n=1 Tax=Streblomastix strix TaxID=222440 RepID=A0A5J4WFS9_9EUKA|nr:MAG: hypothetical protein EZS28_010896 [Streblomastix strix]